MESKTSLHNYKNEIERKVGRNVLLLQQMELMLKFLLTHSKIEGGISDLKENQKKRAKKIQSQTMGQLVGGYVGDVLATPEEIPDDQEASEAYFKFSFILESDAVYVETKKQALASIVCERNELIHHLLPHLDFGSDDSCVNTIQFLDQQYEKVQPQVASLRSQINYMKDAMAFFHSDECKNLIELEWLRASRLVTLLGDISNQVARQDGWTLMSVAGQLIRQHAPEEIVKLKEKYGHKTLKQLMMATELFDIKEEGTDKGGIRVLYKLKPGWELKEI